MGSGQWLKSGWVLMAWLWSGLAAADELDIHIYEVIAVEDPALKIVAEVAGEDSRPAHDVSAEAIEEGFSIKGADIEVEEAVRFEDSDEAFGTVILIDGSHSMHEAKADVRRAVQGFIDGMGPNDMAMIAVFNEPEGDSREGVVHGLEAGWMRDKDQLGDHLGEVMEVDFRHKYTFFNQALDETIDAMLESETAVLSGILLLSDGADSLPNGWTAQKVRTYEQEYPSGQAADRAQEAHIRVSSVYYEPDPEEHSRKVLEKLSRDTGGSLADASDRTEIVQRFSEAQERVHSLWVLRVRTGELVQGQDYTATLAVESGEDQGVGSHVFTMEAAWEGDDDLMSTEEVLTEPLIEKGEKEARSISQASEEESKLLFYVFAGAAGGLLLVILIVAQMQSKKRRRAEEAAEEARVQAQAAQDAARAATVQARAADERAQQAQQAQADAEAKEQERASAEEGRAGEDTSAPAGPAPGGSGRSRKTIFAPPPDASPEALGFVLTVLEGGELNRLIDVFGATAEPMVRVGADVERVHLVLSHATISGHHCTFSRDAENQVVVEDMGSANGTWIDGRDIRGAGPVTLSPGQQIHFGLLKTWYTS